MSSPARPKILKPVPAQFHVSAKAQDSIKLPGVFWAGLKSIGVNPAAVLRHSGLSASVYSGETFITTAQNFAIWRSISELTVDPSVGWKFMSKVETEHYHPTLLAALHARTYRESIERLARYKRLCSAEEFLITQKGNEVLIEVSWPFANKDVPPVLLIDAIFTLVVELGRRGTKTRLNPKRLELARPREQATGLEDYFGCPVEFRTTRNVLVLHADDFELPFVTHNEELLQMLTPQFDKQLDSVTAKKTVTEQVKWVLSRLLSGSRPDLLMVAKELGMSDRTLQRRITDEGTTSRDLLNDTRRELVRKYLGDPSVDINETAFLLGYEDPNSFYRAFRSWEGKTPAEWRAANQGRRAKKN